MVEEQLDRLGGAPAGFAVDEDLAIPRQSVQLVRQGSQRDQARALDAGDGVFLRLADVDEKAFEIAVEEGAEFGGGDGFHVFVSEGAGGWGGGFRIGNAVDFGVVAAEPALRVAVELESSERAAERVITGELAERHAADSENELERLHRLQGADDAGQHAQHAGLLTGRHAARRRHLR